jgi:hypothetical protein
MEMFQRFPYKVRIYQKKGKAYQVIFDHGRRMKLKDGSQKLRLKRMKTDLPFPEYMTVYIDERGHNVVDYYSTGEDEFHPIEITEIVGPDGKIIADRSPIEKDVLLWQILEQKRIREQYAKDQDKWAKLIPIIMIGMVVVSFAAVAIFTYDGLVKISAQASGIATTLDTTMGRIESILEQKTVITQAGTPPPFG